MESNSKERILKAAIKIISQKGKYGTTMEEVAQEANINKAMVYYYYSTKDNLYFEMLKSILKDMLVQMTSSINMDISMKNSHVDIISNVIHRTSDIFFENPDLTRILIDAISSAKDDIPRALEDISKTSDMTFNSLFFSVIESGIKEKIFRDVDPRQTIISIIGMVFICFLSRSIMTVFGIHVKDEDDFLIKREDSIIDLIFNGMLLRNA